MVGDEVPHTHIHLIPFHDLSQLDLTTADGNPDQAGLDAAAERLRRAAPMATSRPTPRAELQLLHQAVDAVGVEVLVVPLAEERAEELAPVVVVPEGDPVRPSAVVSIRTMGVVGRQMMPTDGGPSGVSYSVCRSATSALS